MKVFFILSGLKKIMQAQFTIVNLLHNIFYGAKKYRANYLLCFRIPCILFFLQKNVKPQKGLAKENSKKTNPRGRNYQIILNWKVS